jgi:hypothetical protein
MYSSICIVYRYFPIYFSFLTLHLYTFYHSISPKIHHSIYKIFCFSKKYVYAIYVLEKGKFYLTGGRKINPSKNPRLNGDFSYLAIFEHVI